MDELQTTDGSAVSTGYFFILMSKMKMKMFGFGPKHETEFKTNAKEYRCRDRFAVASKAKSKFQVIDIRQQ